MDQRPILVSKELLEAVLNYLATRPWNEVQHLIAQMQAEVRAAHEGSEGDKNG